MAFMAEEMNTITGVRGTLNAFAGVTDDLKKMEISEQLFFCVRYLDELMGKYSDVEDKDLVFSMRDSYSVCIVIGILEGLQAVADDYGKRYISSILCDCREKLQDILDKYCAIDHKE